MMHLDEGQILSLRDDATAVATLALAHLEECAACRDALEETRRRSASVAAVLGSLDEASWDLDQARERVRQRVAAESARVAGAPSLTARRAHRTAWSASKAAGLLLVTAAGLSALPGSPVRRWITERVAPVTDVVAPAAETAPEAALRAAEEAGVRIPVDGGPLTVVLRDAAPGTEIRVRWIPGREAAVFAPAGSRFTSGQGRMEAGDLSGVVRVELPRSVVPVSLEVNGRIVLRNSAAGLEVAGPVVEQTDAGITYRIPPQ